MLRVENVHLAVVGLGYTGLPLAVEFGRILPTIGFDINTTRIRDLQNGHDFTLETDEEDLNRATHLTFTTDPQEIKTCNVYIITVPTPIDIARQPDFGPLLSASHQVGQLLSAGDVVIYESTVYPGATEEVCVPELERMSGLVFNRDFFVGYSPERINPGDKVHRLTTVVKVTSGSTPAAAEFVDALYQRIITAGTHRTSSIRVAEAAKVIENTQRDINIALVNELALIFHKLGIDTGEVLDAAGTKWNFLPFRPGLVGGHCIGVDPYYLTHKAQSVGYHPEIMLAGRRINDHMGIFVAEQVVRLMAQKRLNIVDARILVLGFTFKENCTDTRNTKVIDIIRELQGYQAKVDVVDPWVSIADAQAEYGALPFIQTPESGVYDAVIIAVAHDAFRQEGAEKICALGHANAVIYDIKSLLPQAVVTARL